MTHGICILTGIAKLYFTVSAILCIFPSKHCDKYKLYNVPEVLDDVCAIYGINVIMCLDEDPSAFVKFFWLFIN